MPKTEVEQITVQELIRRYCETQQAEPEGVREALWRSVTVCGGPSKVMGFMLLRAELMDSSWFGQHTILPYGPGCTWKEVPDHPLSPRGLASDTSVVVAIALREGLEE